MTDIRAGSTVSFTAAKRITLRGHYPSQEITANYTVLDTRNGKEAQIFFANEHKWFPFDQLSLVR